MIGGDRVVALVPARAGSKGLPGKNVRELGGRPLIAWTIATALASPSVDRVVVSTDGAEIAEVARSCGAEVQMRPPELSGDAAEAVDVLRYIRDRLRDEGETARYGVLLQPTSPFRIEQDVERCLELLLTGVFDSVATFVECLHPHRAWQIRDGEASPFHRGEDLFARRQLVSEAHELNGAVYALRMSDLRDDERAVLFGRIGAVAMDRVRSLDIDDELDLLVAEAVVTRGLGVGPSSA